MGSKSRRRVDTSGRRVAIAAGALLAGAGIPLAAAGTAWADDSSDKGGTAGPVIPIPAATPASVEVPSVTGTTPAPTTLSVAQLEADGLSPGDALSVWNAEQTNSYPVEVSVNGKLVLNLDEGTGASNEASAKSSAGDIAIAIGGGDTSTASGKGAVAFTDGPYQDGNNDAAKATGTGAQATVEYAIDSKATASGTYANASVNPLGGNATGEFDPNANDVASASGSYTAAAVTDSNGTTATASGTGSVAQAGGLDGLYAYGDTSTTLIAKGTGDVAAAYASSNLTATASGTHDAVAALDVSTSGDGKSTLTATGTGSAADAGLAVNATATDTNGGSASILDSNNSTAIASSGGSALVFGGTSFPDSNTANASGAGSLAEVINSSGSTALAKGTGSAAFVADSTGSTAKSTNDPYYYSSIASVSIGGYAGVTDGTGSSATATGANSVAEINQVNPQQALDSIVGGGGATYGSVGDSQATATNGGTAIVANDGLAAPSGDTTGISNDIANATNPGSIANVTDSEGSSLTANNGQSYIFSDQLNQAGTNTSLLPEATSAAIEAHIAPSIPLP